MTPVKKSDHPKLLLVGHSQGNFIPIIFMIRLLLNSGVPKENRIGVYGVASPASRVAGRGKYLTSSSDTVINSLMVKIVSYGADILSISLGVVCFFWCCLISIYHCKVFLMVIWSWFFGYIFKICRR